MAALCTRVPACPPWSTWPMSASALTAVATRQHCAHRCACCQRLCVSAPHVTVSRGGSTRRRHGTDADGDLTATRGLQGLQRCVLYAVYNTLRAAAAPATQALQLQAHRTLTHMGRVA